MAYTPAPNKTKTLGYASNFSNFQNDAGRNAMVGIANRILTRDATTVPVTSPTSLTGATTLTLTVPQNAALITISSVTTAVGVTEDQTGADYFLQPANAALSYDVANQKTITIVSSTTTAISFYFSTI